MSNSKKKNNAHDDLHLGCSLTVELLPSPPWGRRGGQQQETMLDSLLDVTNHEPINMNSFLKKAKRQFDQEEGIEDGEHGSTSSSSSCFLVHTRAMHLQRDPTGLITCHSNEEDESSLPMPLLGIALPQEMTHLFLEEYQNVSRLSAGDKNLKDQVREKLLSMIHPSLTQLEPIMWLRNVGIIHHRDVRDPNNDDIKLDKAMSDKNGASLPSFLVGGVRDVLILNIVSSSRSVHPNNSPRRQKNDNDLIDENGKGVKDSAVVEWAALQSIVEDIHGEAMTAAPHRVIQVYTIRKLQFVMAKDDWNLNNHSNIINSNSNTSNDNMLGNGSHHANIQPIMEMPMCPVCRFRITPERLGLPRLKPHQKCSYQGHASCPNMKFLGPWEPCFCKPCRVLQERLEISGARPFIPTSSSPWLHGVGTSWDISTSSTRDGVGGEGRIQCYKCGMEETLWVCLTCGIVGCGRYSYGHAERHYVEYHHPFSLELATQRIWDYETSSFVHREDLLNCPFMQQILGAVNRAAYHGAAMCNAPAGGGADGNDECHGQGQNIGVAKKTIMVGEQYEAMLQSALEDQALHYQGEISRLEAELAAETVNVATLSPAELKQIETLERNIADMREGVEKMSRYLIDAQAEEASHRAKANILLREQSIASKLLDKIRQDFELEQKRGEQQIEELKQQISDISANIRLQERIAKNGNLKEAHIFGTSDVPVKEKSKKRSSRKNRK